MNTFKHSGDIGDILYSLYSIKKAGGGILYLDTTGGVTDQGCNLQCIDKKTKFNKSSYDYLYPLLKQQNYLHDIKVWNGEKVDVNLNDTRLNMVRGSTRATTIIDSYLELLNLPFYTDHNEAWIHINSSTSLDREFVVTRTPRYQSNFAWFQTNKFKLRDKAVFIGLPREHEYFEWTFDIKIPFFVTNTALDTAEALKACKAFITNASSSLAIAIGLGSVSIIQEVDPRVPSCVFKNKNNMNYI